MLESEGDKLRNELNSLVAGECPVRRWRRRWRWLTAVAGQFCGELALRSLDRPFVGADEHEEIASWKCA